VTVNGSYTVLYIFIGILAMIFKGEFVVYLHNIMNYVLSIIQILSCKLQMENETLGKAANTVIEVIKTFEDSRNSESFSNLWEEIENFSIENSIDLQIPARCMLLFSVYHISLI